MANADKTLIIVEGKHDKYFLHALCKAENLSAYFRLLDGIGNIKKELNELKPRIKKGEYNKIAIIVDCDDDKNKNFKKINDAMNEVFKKKFKSTQNNFIDVDEMLFGCFFMGIKGKGSLDNILKKIRKNKRPIHADCLDSWRDCIKEKEISDKEYIKLWRHIYVKYDCFPPKERCKANKLFEQSMKNHKDYWDFKHESLNGLKEFLQSFSAK